LTHGCRGSRAAAPKHRGAVAAACAQATSTIMTASATAAGRLIDHMFLAPDTSCCARTVPSDHADFHHERQPLALAPPALSTRTRNGAAASPGRSLAAAGRRRLAANGCLVRSEGPDPGRVHLPRRRPAGETLLGRAERIADAYGLVLVLILTTFVVTVTLPPQGWVGRVAAVAIAGATAIVALTSSDVSLARVRLAVGAASVAVAAAVCARALDAEALLGAAFTIDALLLTVATGTILRRVVLATDVEFRTILGAISVFTLIGLLFGFALLALGRLRGNDVFAGVQDASPQDYLFFSYTTLTTTGYGNLVPDGQIGQILAVLEMLTGQIFLVTLVARLVSLWRPATNRLGESER
jgi:Ion channel